MLDSARLGRLAPRRAWVALVVGVLLVGVGVGMMLDGGLGVSPGDVFFSGLARATGLSVGTVVVVSALLMVAATWRVGIRPGAGTIACILLIGPAVDGMRHLDTLVGVAGWGTVGHTAWWAAGLLVFTVGVVGLFSADLGVSPYDQVTLATARLTRRSLGFARFVVDGTFFLAGASLGGSWGVGTVVLLLAVPFALNRVLPVARRWVRPGAAS